MDTPEISPRTAMLRLLNGYRVTQMMYVAARLEVADLLAEGPRTADELAQATGADASALYRVLQALASLGVFAESAERRFSLTPLATLLQVTHPDSIHARTIFTSEQTYRPWGDLLYSVTTGAPAFDHQHGVSHFAYLAGNAAASAVFDHAMSEGARQAASAVAPAYDFPAAGTVVDVGGGEGRLLAAILRAHPALRGVLFDLPHVLADAEPVLREAGVVDRCELVGGDIFAAVPPGADLYTLRHILHDWDDEHSIAILHTCARALPAHGKVLVIEAIIEPGGQAPQPTFLDLQMLVMTGGRERTAQEYERLFAAAGLRLTRIIPTASEASIIEGQHA